MTPYVLLAVAAIVLAIGFTKASGIRGSHGLVWGSLLVWAILMGVGIWVWMMSARFG
jgi:hypothetical protein